METEASPQPAQTSAKWQPLPAACRRVAGVLVEKAKTTPDAYPMTLNALVAGCNQKSNRYPLMQLEPDDVEQALDKLREMGAAAIVQGSGRVSKYRHYMYEWLGVEKAELGVMTELLLRGAQTEGELRAHASRMDAIPDLPALRVLLEALKAKGLVLPLTPEGRGHVVTHALYLPQELEKVRSQFAGGAVEEAPALRSTRADASHASASDSDELAALRRELEELRGQVTQMRGALDDLTFEFQSRLADFDRLREAVGG